MKNYFIESKNIGFSTWKEDDFSLVKSLWGNKEVTRYIATNGEFSENEIKERLSKEINNQNSYGVQYWPIFLKETDEFIGCCGLRPYQLENKIYEIGFHLIPLFWGKGFAMEAAKIVIDYGFHTLKVNDLFAGHNPNNKNSAKILNKLGFHYTHDEFYLPTGLYHPSYRYKILNFK
ncbi:GNAT family N-acetyltransferase [Fusobacterium sp. PH5-44]|uniref:GNAT family N-acetyltransferase n=1 Tax=unclassified Fusobacterium TaxID=2648384 RepID=UPI003D1FBB87